jgi:transposase
MEDQALIKRAHELQALGKSIRQIAVELQVSKSKVFRWLGQSGNDGMQMPIASFAKNNKTMNQFKNQKKMENHNDPQRLEREIALKKLQLEHELALRKLAQQDKELELRRRQMELKHQENDQVQRQQKIEENRILHNLKKWLKTEQALLEQFDYEEIELPVKIFRKRLKELQKLIEQSEEHASSYSYDLDEQTFITDLHQLHDHLFELLNEFEEEWDEDDDSGEIPTISYEWPEELQDSIEILEYSEFFS